MVVRYHYLHSLRFLVLLINFNNRHCTNTDCRWAIHHGLVIIFVYMTANAAFRLYSNNRNLWWHGKSVKLFSERIWSHILSKIFIFAKYMVLFVSYFLYCFSFLLHCRSLLQPQISGFNRLEIYNICILLQCCLERWALRFTFNISTDLAVSRRLLQSRNHTA